MNQITIAGNLGTDPEVRFTSSGAKVTTLRVASRSRRSGKEETIWWKVTVWGEQFDKMISFLKKGSSIIVVGDMNKPEIFTDKEGKPQVSMSMTAYHIMFSPFGKPEGSGAPGQTGAARDSGGYQGSSGQGSSYGAPQSSSRGGDHDVSYGQGDAMSFADEEVPF